MSICNACGKQRELYVYDLPRDKGICEECYVKRCDKGEQDYDTLRQREDDFREGLEDRAESRNNDRRADV